MKKNDWILMSCVCLYSFLFYDQRPGINFVLFNMALIAASAIFKREVLSDLKWKFVAVSCFVSSVCIGLYANPLTVFANVISLSLLSAFNFSTKTSVFVSVAFSFYSYFSAILFMMFDWINRQDAKRKSPPNEKPRRKLFLFIVPVVITILFFFLYRSSNILFNDFTKDINLDFISVGLIFFTIIGFILLYGFFYHRRIAVISEFDESPSNQIDPHTTENESPIRKKMSLNDEIFSGTLLFVLINGLLLIMNVLDLNYLFSQKLPEGVTFSEFVHHGIGALIFSIIIAIAIIMFYFRGELNFSGKSRTIKALALIWIFQNAFMIFSTMTRNMTYIAFYGLTYLRIGVFIYLLLAFIGLVTTFIKIIRKKSNFYLFRINSWIFYSILVVSCFFNWDNIIAKFNIQDPDYDKEYLLELSYTSLPLTYNFIADVKNPNSEIKKIAYEESDFSPDEKFQKRISDKLNYFFEIRQNTGWRSWCYDDKKIYDELMLLNSNSKIEFIRLPNRQLRTLNGMQELNNVSVLLLNSNYFESLDEIKSFTNLKVLDLSNNRLHSLKGIEEISKLQYLFISGNNISDFLPLTRLKDLKQVHISDNIPTAQLEVLKSSMPSTDFVVE